ncbi:hypothetical protein LINPERPRIM_LOCUS32538 [Linum perenne]
MGTCDSSLPGIFSGIFIFQAYETCLHLSMCDITVGTMLESNKACEVIEEEETENASAFIHVNKLAKAITPPRWELLNNVFFCKIADRPSNFSLRLLIFDIDTHSCI